MTTTLNLDGYSPDSPVHAEVGDIVKVCGKRISNKNRSALYLVTRSRYNSYDGRLIINLTLLSDPQDYWLDKVTLEPLRLEGFTNNIIKWTLMTGNRQCDDK